MSMSCRRLELLNEAPPKPVRQEKAAQEKQAILMQTLNDFKIGANVSRRSRWGRPSRAMKCS